MTTTDMPLNRQIDNPFLALPGGGVGPQPAAMPGPVGTVARQEPSAFRRLHALLRGRYLLAGILCGVGAVTGAVVGFRSQQPQYTSTGMVEVKLIVQSMTQPDRIMLLSNQFLGNQINFIQTQRLLDVAMDSPEWRATGKGVSPEVQAEFRDRLNVDVIPGSTYIRFEYQDPNPAVARAAVSSVINAYAGLYRENSMSESEGKRQVLTTARTSKEQEIDQKRLTIAALAKDYGSFELLDTYHNARVTEMLSLEAQLAQAKQVLQGFGGPAGSQASAPATRPATPGGEPVGSEARLASAGGLPSAAEIFAAPQGPTVDEIATVDQVVRDALRAVRDAEFQIRRLEAQFGGNSRTVQTARRELQIQQEQLDESIRSFRSRYVGVRIDPTTGQPAAVSPGAVKQMEERVARLQDRYELVKDEAAKLGEKRYKIQLLRSDIDRMESELGGIDRTIENLKAEKELSGEVKQLGYPSTPGSPSKDARRKMAILGFTGGGLVPLSLLLLIGLLDKRYRYSDDHADSLPHVPLLGILPNLPNLSTDPQQATVAAHCVHQIRTMLEIAADTQGRRAFAVTSPSPTDGKTSLSLALGLSFAAAGTRTLLIDCDVIGGGLSARMNQTHPTGTLEAVASRDLASFVKPTDVANLSILPVGTQSNLHPTILSPTALGRLIAEAKARYDVVLVDTGPVLGSVEASPACASCDATVLVVSRGRQKAQVQRSLDHLVSIGARLAGVVFNRASSPDFDRSTSRLALRAEPAAETLQA